jgi:hypothetical protein
MTASPSIDRARLLHEQLEAPSPGPAALGPVRAYRGAMSAEADAICGCRVRDHEPGTGQRPQPLPTPRLRHPRRHPGYGDPDAAVGDVFPRLAARAPPPGRGRPDVRGGHQLPSPETPPGGRRRSSDPLGTPGCPSRRIGTSWPPVWHWYPASGSECLASSDRCLRCRRPTTIGHGGDLITFVRCRARYAP